MGRPTISSTQRIALFVATALLGAALLTPTIGATSPGAIAAKKGKKRLKPITGKLSKRDYTVIALAENGKAATVQVKGHRFRLRPPAPQVTLHLRAPDGTYAGPVVLGRASGGNGKASATGKKGKRARGPVVVGVEAGANLGKIGVHPGKGYAKVRKQPRKFVDAELVARATKKGVPIGNGLNVGLVRSKAKGHGSDPDLDGVPNSLDIDDDGDLILDSYDTPGQARGSRDATRSLDSPSATPFMDAFTSLFAGGADAVNVNGGSSDQQIDASVQNHAQLGILWGGVDPGSAELNCGALIYCRSGGTGRYAPIGSTPIADTQPFPACCDPDHDGFGSLPNTPSQAASDFHGMKIYTGATADQERAGDVVIAQATRDGSPVELVSSLGFVFSTFPVLAAYDDGQGNSGTFTYPHAEGAIPVRAGPSGDIVVRLKFWRPQRRRVEGDPGEGAWMDVGHLIYTTAFNVPMAQSSPTNECPGSSYSDVDPSLSLQPSPGTVNHLLPPDFTGSHFDDLAADQPSNPANTFSFTLNLTSCLAAYGQTMTTTNRWGFVLFAFALAGGSPGEASFQYWFQLQQ